MKVILSPLASSHTTDVSVSGDVITVDGQSYDLSGIPEGHQVDAESPAAGIIKRVNGEIEVTILYFYASHLAELEQSPDIADYTFTVTDGPVPCPISWKPIINEEAQDV